MTLEHLLVNIKNNNNFYVSNKVIDNINWKIKEYDKKIKEYNNKKVLTPEEKTKLGIELNQLKVTKEETELLKMVDNRRNLCKSENIHYWILPSNNSNEPYKSTCHWCSMKITDYK